MVVPLFLFLFTLLGAFFLRPGPHIHSRGVPEQRLYYSIVIYVFFCFFGMDFLARAGLQQQA